MSLITLLTDFGHGKYVASMKGVILSINPEAKIVDIDHEVSHQNVTEGSFVLASAVNYFPPAIHVAVVDPGVGSSRRPLVVECERGVLVGPDNGLLFPASQVLNRRRAFEITEEEYCLPRVSSTFHGRDIFAPVAGHLSLGVSADSVGAQVTDIVELSFGEFQVSDEEVRGEVLYVDRFGNLVTNVPAESFPSWISVGRVVEMDLGGHHELQVQRSYSAVKSGQPFVTTSSDGFLEIAVNRGSAAKLFQSEQGDLLLFRRPGKG